MEAAYIKIVERLAISVKLVVVEFDKLLWIITSGRDALRSYTKKPKFNILATSSKSIRRMVSMSVKRVVLHGSKYYLLDILDRIIQVTG